MIVKTVIKYKQGEIEYSSNSKTISWFECDRVTKNFANDGKLNLILTTSDDQMREKTRHVIEDASKYVGIFLMNDKGKTIEKLVDNGSYFE